MNHGCNGMYTLQPTKLKLKASTLDTTNIMAQDHATYKGVIRKKQGEHMKPSNNKVNNYLIDIKPTFPIKDKIVEKIRAISLKGKLRRHLKIIDNNDIKNEKNQYLYQTSNLR